MNKELHQILPSTHIIQRSLANSLRTMIKVEVGRNINRRLGISREVEYSRYREKERLQLEQNFLLVTCKYQTFQSNVIPTHLSKFPYIQKCQLLKLKIRFRFTILAAILPISSSVILIKGSLHEEDCLRFNISKLYLQSFCRNHSPSLLLITTLSINSNFTIFKRSGAI